MLLFILGLGVLVTGRHFITVPESRVINGVVLVILVGCILFFNALTVEVSREELVVAFGFGVIRKIFRLEEILNVREVRNPWYYGWGIRLAPHGWLFNLSGLNAVELELKNNRKFRIGTDDPQNLTTSIQMVRGLRSQ